jgi:type VI secretion system protein ImpH
MATQGGTEDSGLIKSEIEEALREDACSFEFFQAVHLLQRLGHGRQPVGQFFNPDDESVRFSVNNALAFPASQVQSLVWADHAPPRMKVNFMGITGPMGVLPYSYTELILERNRAKDHTLESFFDIFNHRAISLFYRGWEKYRFPVTYGVEGRDLFSQHLLDLIGLGTPGLQDRQPLPDQALLHYAGLLGLQSRSAAGLQQMIADYFDVPVEVEQFAGAWYPLAPDTQCCMDEYDSDSQQLGGGAVVGDQVWDQQSRIRLRLGPLTMEQYREFLPEGSGFEPLRAFTRFFSNEEFDFELQLILKREEAPAPEIGLEGDSAMRLGWVSWLKSSAMQRDPDETILNL